MLGWALSHELEKKQAALGFGPAGECQESLSRSAWVLLCPGVEISLGAQAQQGLCLPSRSPQSPWTSSSKWVKQAEAGLPGEHGAGGRERRQETHCLQAGGVGRPGPQTLEVLGPAGEERA